MSDLSDVKEILEKDCFCHDSDIGYMFECMPDSIFHGELKSDCRDSSYCYHKQEKFIKEKLQQFKCFLETGGRFKVGDRVELAETPVINEKDSYGWLGDKHYLIEGAKATVEEVSYYHGQFVYAISVDNESWKDQQGVLHPRNDKKCTIAGCDFPHNRHVFSFAERKLRPITRERCSFLSRLWTEFYRKAD